MTSRADHTFGFTGAELADAAVNAARRERELATWWRAQLLVAVNEAQVGFITVRAYPLVNGGSDMRYEIGSARLQRRVDECTTAYNTHRDNAAHYLKEAQLYTRDAGRNFELSSDEAGRLELMLPDPMVG